MNNLKKLFIAVMIGCFGFFNLAYAELGDSPTILPMIRSVTNCSKLLNTYNNSGTTTSGGTSTSVSVGNIQDVLACAIQTGRVSLPMIPYFIQYFANYLLGLVALIALLFTVIGGVYWTAGGAVGQKEAGKKFITEAIIGMAISLLAWAIVNVILSAFTG